MEHNDKCITRDPVWVRKFGVDQTPAGQCPHCIWLRYYKNTWEASTFLFVLFILMMLIGYIISSGWHTTSH